MDLYFLSAEQRDEVNRIAELNGIVVDEIIQTAVQEWLTKNERNEELHWRFPKMLPASEPITIDGWGCCLSETCSMRRECAQHTTAGDFRTDDGIAPMLVKNGIESARDLSRVTTPSIQYPTTVRCCTVVDSRYNTGFGFIPRDVINSTSPGGIPRPLVGR